MSELTTAVQEPLLKENKNRFVLFPIEHDDIWQYYKKAEASIFTKTSQIGMTNSQKTKDTL